MWQRETERAGEEGGERGEGIHKKRDSPPAAVYFGGGETEKERQRRRVERHGGTDKTP